MPGMPRPVWTVCGQSARSARSPQECRPGPKNTIVVGVLRADEASAAKSWVTPGGVYGRGWTRSNSISLWTARAYRWSVDRRGSVKPFSRSETAD